MSGLTKEEIEYLTGQFALLAARADWKPKSIDRIRAFGDLALQALSLESVRSEALAELGNIADAERFNRERFRDDSDFADWAQSRCRYIRATLSPARVAEGGEEKK